MIVAEAEALDVGCIVLGGGLGGGAHGLLASTLLGSTSRCGSHRSRRRVIPVEQGKAQARLLRHSLRIRDRRTRH